MSRVPAAERTLSLLRLMAELGQPTTANRLAQSSRYQDLVATSYLKSLNLKAFAIHFTEDKRWGLGLAAWELGSAYKRHDHWKDSPGQLSPSL